MKPHPLSTWLWAVCLAAFAILPASGCYVSNAELSARAELAELRRESIAETRALAEKLDETMTRVEQAVREVRQASQDASRSLRRIQQLAARIPAGGLDEGPMSTIPGEAWALDDDPLDDTPEAPAPGLMADAFSEPTPPLDEVIDLSTVTLPRGEAAKPYMREEGYKRADWMDGKLTLIIEPLDPIPPLEELLSNHEWEDRPVLDGLELLIQRLRDEPQLVSVDEALKLHNNSEADNAAILSALGRQPESDSEIDYEATFRRHLGGDIKTTNPLLYSSVYEGELLSLISFGLFSFDEDFIPFAASESVTSWRTSQDRMYDIVTLRDDLLWSDGTPITAHDVAFSYKVIMTQELPIPAVRSGTEDLRWVHAYDDRTVVFFHQESLATNVWNINFPVIPKHIYEASIAEDSTLRNSKRHQDLDARPVTGGAYNLVRRTVGTDIFVRRRESYYIVNGQQVRPKPRYRSIRMRIIPDGGTALLALKSGEIDEMQLQPEQWTSQTNDADYYENNTKATGLAWDYYYIGWNVKGSDRRPFFRDRRVREALAWALDYNELMNVKLQGLYSRSNGIFHPTSWMAHRPALPPFKEDLDKAAALLDEAGWTDSNGDGFRDKMIDGRRVTFEFTLLCPQDPLRKAMADQFSQDFRRLGIRCQVRVTEFAALLEALSTREFDAYLLGLGTGTDPYTSVNIFGSDADRNYFGYSNTDVDKLFHAGQREFDPRKRAAIYAHIQRLIYEDQPCCFLFVRNSFWGFNKNVRGLRFSPRGPFGFSPGFGALWRPADQ